MSCYLDTFRQSKHVLLQDIHIVTEPTSISIEFYAECSSISVDYRKFMASEKLTIKDCRASSKVCADRYSVVDIDVSDFKRYCLSLLSVLYE
jgi:hypothetical protein